jgi:hypothetical protein
VNRMPPSNCTEYKLCSRLEEVGFAGRRALLERAAHGKLAVIWTPEYMKVFLTHLEDLGVFVQNEAVRRQRFQHRGFVLDSIRIYLWQRCNQQINT